MHETADDLRDLQRIIDESHAGGGAHLRSIFTDDKRLSAEDLSRLLTGVQVLVLATVTARGEPRAAPVDGLFFRGRFWFGSSHDSVRFRHIRARPSVSAVVARGEELAVIVHGTAHEVDLSTPEGAPFRRYLHDVYGTNWEDWGGSAPYARIEPAKMFTYATRR